MNLDFDAEGHVDHHVREAVRRGVDLLQAYRIATLNAALYYRIGHLVGSITLAKLAYMLILDDLTEARPAVVIMNGEIVARDNKALFENQAGVPSSVLGTMNLNPVFLYAATYRTFPKSTNATYAYVQAIEMYDGYFKRTFHAKLFTDVAGGHLKPNIELDMFKLVVVDRHHATKNFGTAFVRGFGLRRGAIACTTNCENQNLVVLGKSHDENAFAPKSVHEIRGGFMTVAHGSILGSVALEVAGCMSKNPWEHIAQQGRELDEVVASQLLGREDESTGMKVRFMILSFVVLVGVPDLVVMELGLAHTAEQSLINVVLNEEDVHRVETAVAQAPALFTRVRCRCPSHAHDIII